MADPASGSRLGAAELSSSLDDLDSQAVTSFRAVPDRATLAPELGPLNDLPGRWHGSGFNLIARPDAAQSNDIFLELNLTTETLEFTTIGSPIPNRGSGQGDIFLHGVTYLQQITDTVTKGALHIEPGIWVRVPASKTPPEPESVARLATIPHGDAVCAVGTASKSEKPDIEPINTAPFGEKESTPAPGSKNDTFPEYDLSKPSRFRTPADLLGGISQEMVLDPTVKLRHDLHNQNILDTQVLEVTTHHGGGVSNIPFVTVNANAAFVKATFWIERVQGASDGTFLQLQYVQTVLLNFLGLNWPHVSVATLVKAF